MSALMRLAQRSTVEREAALERCELCGTAIGPEHRHVLELATRDVKCACRPCGLLFERADRMRLIPADVRRVGRPWTSACRSTWRSSCASDGEFKAFYPSPVGPTESLLAVDRSASSWPTTSRRCWCAASAPGSCGIDVCFALVGLVRTHWRGITGGAEVRRELDAFFDGLDRRAR